MSRLDGKVAIVTGGASGIGFVTGRFFAQQGAKVLLVDLQNDKLRKAVEKIELPSVSYAVADVSQPDQTAQYVQTAVDCCCGLDILISNAGMVGGGEFYHPLFR